MRFLLRLSVFAAFFPAFAAPCPAQQPGAPPAAPAYENPPVFRASELLTAEQLAGPYHKVRDEVATDGITNTWTIDSDFGPFVVHGNDMLPVRLREIYAIAAIRKTKESDAYGRALTGAAKGTIDGAKNLVTDPANTLSGMGKGAMRFMKGATERARTMTEDTGTAAGLEKYSDARRQIAGHYGVDPYTSNAVLRKEIDELAMATAAGNLTFSLAMMAVPAKGLGFVAKGISASTELNQMLLDKGPYTLRTENRDRLRAMAIDEALIESFLNHEMLNPKHQTVIALALSKLQGARGRGTFLRLAMASQSDEDAHFFERVAELMVHYQQGRSPAVEIVDFNGMPACYTAQKTLVLPVPLDYGSWTEVGDRLTRFFLEFKPSGLAIEGHEFFITGTISPRAREEARARGLVVAENAFGA